MMIWLTTIVVVLVMGGVVLVAAGRGAPLMEEYDDRPDAVVPAGVLRGDDLRRVRFAVTFRGYRMSEVDALLDRLAAQLDAGSPATPADDSERPGHDRDRG